MATTKSCVYRPTINDLKSVLYEQLVKNIKEGDIVNFLYALSKLPEVTRKLTDKNDFTFQNEPTYEALDRILNISKVLDSSSIQTALNNLGAYDSSGNLKFFSDITPTLWDKVRAFNSGNNHLKAELKLQDKGFYIEVNPVRTGNFRIGTVMDLRKYMWQEIISKLNTAGLLHSISPYAYKQFNILKGKGNLALFKKLNEGRSITFDQAAILFDLFKHKYPDLATLASTYHQDVITAISNIASGNTVSATISTADVALIERIVRQIKRDIKIIFPNSVIKNIENNADAITNADTLLGGTIEGNISQTLKELYANFNLNVNELSEIGDRIKTLTLAAEKIIFFRAKQLNILKLKGKKNPSGERALMRAEKAFREARYNVSTLRMLEFFLRKLTSLHTNIKNSPVSTITSTKQIIKLGKMLLELKETWTAIFPILEALTSDLIENDSGLSSSDWEEVRKVAKSLLDLIKRNDLVNWQKDLVTQFITLVIPKNINLKELDISVDDIVAVAEKDTSLLDRFLWSVDQSNDEMLNIVMNFIKDIYRALAKESIEFTKICRSIDAKVRNSAKNTSFMFESDELGYPSKILSDYDYAKMEKEFLAYRETIRRDPSIDVADYKQLENKWLNDHTKEIEFNYFYMNDKTKPRKMIIRVPTFMKSVKVVDKLNPGLFEYWQAMMNLKASYIEDSTILTPETLFDVIELGENHIASLEKGIKNPKLLFKSFKNTFLDLFKRREDTVDYGSLKVSTNYNDETIDLVPLFFTHKIKDRSRVTTDFTRAMIAYANACGQYEKISEVVDMLLLVKDWMQNERKLKFTEDGATLYDVFKGSLFGRLYKNSVNKATKESFTGGLIEDAFDTLVYGRRKSKSSKIFNTNLTWAELGDGLTRYTSITGLVTNIPGSITNLLVGKLQMLIESAADEFFGFTDMLKAEGEYFRMLGPCLNEFSSNIKSNMLYLLMLYFDVMDDFMEKVKDTTFYNNNVSKIIGNTELFFLYHSGEHCLHGTGMLARLINIKVRNKRTGKVTSLLKAFYVDKDEQGNGTLKFNSDYVLHAPGNTNLDGKEITEEYLEQVKKEISYVNRSMHGAFGALEKGMVHRYVLGRLLLNFRQWMPAHFARRFRGRYFDVGLGKWREGFYVSTAKFLYNAVKGLLSHKINIMQYYQEIKNNKETDPTFYNLRRTIAEVIMLATLYGIVNILGSAKDYRNRWAARMLFYLLLRLRTEVAASSPFSFTGFFDNLMTLLKSPMACLSTLDKVGSIFEISDMFKTIESGPNKGDNQWWHDAKKAIPFYYLLHKTVNIGTDNSLFAVFQ